MNYEFFKSHSFVFTVLILYFIFLILALAPSAQGDIYSSDNFQTLDPVMNSGGYGSSASFKLFGSISEIAIGTSTSATFKDSVGFLYFPFATTPVVSATAGDSQVALSWTASTGYLGWTASGYNVGQSTTSGGPYTYSSSLGNVISSTRAGLTNGATYYFVIRVEDAFENFIATSTEVSAIPVAPVVPPPSGGGGGGGGSYTPPATSVILQGKAYPNASLTILKDSKPVVITKADPQADFKVQLTTLTAGTYTFSIWAEDKDGRKSVTYSFTVTVTSGTITTVSGIFIPPTIDLIQNSVKKGEVLDIHGQTAPLSSVDIYVYSDEIIKKTEANESGIWNYSLDTAPLSEGSHTTKAKSVLSDLISTFSQTLSFYIGKGVSGIIGQNADLNGDGRVNLVDFSILLYWWGRANNCADQNNSGIVDLADFSIMMYWWTG